MRYDILIPMILSLITVVAIFIAICSEAEKCLILL